MNRAIDIRRSEVADLDACYAISLATGLAGGDASHLYVDPRLMGHIYFAPYALLEPALVLVVADGDSIAGFVAGTSDTPMPGGIGWSRAGGRRYVRYIRTLPTCRRKCRPRTSGGEPDRSCSMPGARPPATASRGNACRRQSGQ